MHRRNWIACAVWTVAITTVTAYRSESLELMEHCCAYKCGKIDEPLLMNSDGLDMKEYQYSELKVTFDVRALGDADPYESYCVINIYTLEYTMLNLTYTLKSDEDDYTVVIMDSARVTPKQKTAEGIYDDGDDNQAEDRRGIFNYSRNNTGPSVRLLLRKSTKPSVYEFELRNYRITPNRMFTIAVKFEALQQRKVYNFDASFVADSGTAGRTFFIILGVVVVFFVVGVASWFFVYKRYYKKKKKGRRGRQQRQMVHFNSDSDTALYHADDSPSPEHVDQDVPRWAGAPNTISTVPANARRRLSLSERIRKVTNRKSEVYIPPVLPKHELLQKQERNMGAQRPLSVGSPVEQKTEFTFPGIDPGNEGDSPPQTVERSLQTSRNRVVSHIIISEDEIYDDRGTPSLVQDSTEN